MTLRELFREFVVGVRAAREQHARDMSLAWHVEALHRQKKLPDLKKLLPSRPDVKQSTGHHKTMLEMIGARTGIKLGKTRLRPASELKGRK